MTRLFLRFYLGVVAILIVAWLVQSVLLTRSNVAKNVAVVEQALGGGMRLALDRLNAASKSAEHDTVQEELQRIQQRFDYPLRIVAVEDIDLSRVVLERLRAGQIVYVFTGAGYVVGMLAGQKQLLVGGPLPTLVGPDPIHVMAGFGAVLLVAAIGIAFLLRPVVKQMREIERAALAIASGDLSARAEKLRKGGPIALAEAFNSMAERTEKMLVAQKELLQAVSHELRTPLARIRFATDMLSLELEDSESRRRLQTIDQATSELDDLVGELLSYVRLETLDVRGRREVFDVIPLIKDVIEARQDVFSNTEIHFRCGGEARLMIAADRKSIERAIGNLVSNAGRFAKKCVEVSLRLVNGQLVIDVDDDGPGIAEADRERIFEPFVRLGNTRGRGAGLGLALVARIAKSHHGTVEVDDSPLGGAKFRLILPCVTSAVDEIHPTAPAE